MNPRIQFKRTTINFIKEFQEFKEDKKKQINEIKQNKLLSDAQENTNIKLMEIAKTTQDLRKEFNQETETLNRTQVEMKKELENTIA